MIICVLLTNMWTVSSSDKRVEAERKLKQEARQQEAESNDKTAGPDDEEGLPAVEDDEDKDCDVEEDKECDGVEEEENKECDGVEEEENKTCDEEGNKKECNDVDKHNKECNDVGKDGDKKVENACNNKDECSEEKDCGKKDNSEVAMEVSTQSWEQDRRCQTQPGARFLKSTFKFYPHVCHNSGLLQAWFTEELRFKVILKLLVLCYSEYTIFKSIKNYFCF